MWGILQHPSFLKGVWQRYRSLNNTGEQQFLHMEGARSEYLCWKKGADGTINMMLLDKIKFKMMAELGVKEVFFEIDRHNERLFNTQMRDKTITLLSEYQLPDGRSCDSPHNMYLTSIIHFFEKKARVLRDKIRDNWMN